MFEMEAFLTEVRPNYKSRVVLVMSIFYQEMLTINRLSCVGVRMCTYTYTNSFCSRHTPEMIENTFPIILRLTGRRWSPALLFCAELTMKQRGEKKKLTIFPYGRMSCAISWIMAFPQTSELQLWQRKYSAAKTVTFNYMNIKCRVHSGVVLCR